MIPTDTVAHWIALAMVVAGLATWAWLKAKWHRDDRARRKANLAAGIASERRLALMVDDPDESTQEILAVDPPVVPAYITCAQDWEDDDNCDTSGTAHRCVVANPHEDHRCACGGEYLTYEDMTLPPIAKDPVAMRLGLVPVPDGMVLYRGGAVHPECAQRWLRFDLAPVDGCAVWLTDEKAGAV